MLSEIELIYKAKHKNPWNLGNEILYKLCKDHFLHTEENILTKVLFIGRIYAAAVERRKIDDGLLNEDFYIQKVIPAFKELEHDLLFDNLKNYNQIDLNNIADILEVHGILQDKLFFITELKKRSFCSKYLHFHFPNLYFIYDSRAVLALTYLTRNLKWESIFNINGIYIDNVYSLFFYKCYQFKKHLEEKYNLALDNRQFDMVLMHQANQINSPKKKKSKRKTNNNSENS